MAQSQYQTLSQFFISPFNTGGNMDKDIKYRDLYNEFVKKNRIRVEGFTEIEGSYYIHMKVPSESKSDKKYEYDVVIRFFTDREDVKKQDNLNFYYIQFFSNSPSFIYKYAALYKQKGYLIEQLQDKLDQQYADVMPEKTNSKMELSYDKSIFFACKKISEMKFRILNKHGFIIAKKKTPEKFFRDISDFNTIKIDQELINEEKKLKRTLKRNNDNHIKKKDTTVIVTSEGKKVLKARRISPKKKIGPKAKIKATKKVVKRK